MFGRVHLITDSRPGCDPVAQVRAALAMATADLVIQFRPADDWTDRLVLEQATQIMALARPLGVPILINDRVDIALAVGADGAHVGADDLPVSAARRLLGPDRIVGATARNATMAAQAMTDGASYVGAGPCFPSSTKDGLPDPLAPKVITEIAAVAPTIAIGGVTLDRTPGLLALGAHGIAVIAAVADAPDPGRALAALLSAVSRG